MKKRLLITGISGLLGSNLAYCLKEEYEILGLYCRHKVLIDGARTAQVDLTSMAAVNTVVDDFAPDIIFHGAAQANVETCERFPAEAEKINVESTDILVNAARRHAVKLVYVSTDLVYGGDEPVHTEASKPNPRNVYAQTKLRGEFRALACDGALVLRTNFFGWNILPKKNLAELVIEELKNGRTMKGFTDAVFSSIYTFDLAYLIRTALERNLQGVYNCACSSALSKYDFLVSIARATGLDPRGIEPISVDDFSFSAKRSKNLRLDVSKLARDTGLKIPSIEESIGHFVSDLTRQYSHFIGAYIGREQIYPQLNVFPYGRQMIDALDIIAVTETMKSSNLTQGPRIAEFERALCRLTDAKHAAVVNSGTAALHLACLAAGLTSADEGITSPNSFVASANCIAYCGATPVFSDIDPHTYNIDPAELEEKITVRTKVVIPVHFAGQSCDMRRIYDIVRRKEKEFGKRIFIIEDASHALGSRYEGQAVGSCRYADMTTFSFHPVKHITTGEGGAVLTNDTQIHARIKMLASHGITGDPARFEAYQENDFYEPGNVPAWYYEQQYLGFNYRITDIQCALGLSQLEKLPAFMQKRRKIVEYYNNCFGDIEHLRVPFQDPACQSNFHLYVLLIDFKRLGVSRTQLMGELWRSRIRTQVHYIPIYTQPYYRRRFSTHWGQCPRAEAYYAQCLSIPLYPAMNEQDMCTVSEKIVAAVQGVKAW